MIAATLEVQIQAEIAGFKKQLAEVVNNAKSEGENAAKGFRGKFNNWMQDSTSQIAAKGMKILSPIAIAESFTTAIKAGGEGGFVAGLEALVNSTPIVSTGYQLGTAIGNVIGDAISDADEMEVAMESKLNAFKSKIPAVLAQLAEDTQERETLATGGVKSAALDAQLAIQSARYIGNERLAITLENAEKEKELRTKTDLELAQTSSEAARAQIESNFAKEKELMQRLVRDKFQAENDKESALQAKKIDDEVEKQAKAQAAEEKRVATARDLLEEELNFANDKANAQADAQKAFMEDAAAADAAAASAAEALNAATIGNGATALGSFKFDAYPDSDKKSIDQRIANASLTNQQWVRRSQCFGAHNPRKLHRRMILPPRGAHGDGSRPFTLQSRNVHALEPSTPGLLMWRGKSGYSGAPRAPPPRSSSQCCRHVWTVNVSDL